MMPQILTRMSVSELLLRDDSGAPPSPGVQLEQFNDPVFQAQVDKYMAEHHPFQYFGYRIWDPLTTFVNATDRNTDSLGEFLKTVETDIQLHD